MTSDKAPPGDVLSPDIHPVDVLPVDQAIRWRRAERDFDPAPLPAEVLEAILDDARHAPSGYNLQPTRFISVEGPVREDLARAAFDQAQVRVDPVTVVVTADTRPDLTHGRRIEERDLEARAIDGAYADFQRRMVSLMFRRGPLGVVGRLKGLASVVLRPFRPMPRFPAARPREWAIAQGMLVASHVLLSAAARGVASCPMEGFDEGRVRRLLGVPRSSVVVLLIPLGYSAVPDESRPRRSRLPLCELLERAPNPTPSP